MKKLIYLLVGLLVFVSCEYEGEIYDPETDFAQLETSSVSVAEDAESGTLLLRANAPGTVNFSVSASDMNRFTFTPSDGVVEFTEGELEKEITIIPIDNIDNDGNQEINVELTDGGSLAAGIGGEGNFKKSATVLIVDNDCPTEISAQYAVEVFAFGDTAPEYNVDLVPVAGTTNQFTVYSAWGPTFVSWATGANYDGQYLYPATITLNEDFTVTVTGGGSLYPGGSGTYSACGDQFSLTLQQAVFSGNPFTVNVEMTGI